MILRPSFTNKNGIKYDNVQELAFNKNNFYGNLGEFINETKKEETDFIDSEFNLENGVYIYRDFNNYKKAYRIYKEFNDYGFNGYKDDLLIHNLVKRSKNLKLSKVPYGVVTIDGNIIGQIIPYFYNTKTLYEYSLKNKINPELLIEVLKIIKELYENGIYYYDIHPKNFVIDQDKKINIIDFDNFYVKFIKDENTLKNILNGYKNILSILSRINIHEDINSFNEAEDFTYKYIK